jgi:hypothetical protein
MDDLDFGNGFTGHWVGWRPDRELNPQYKDIPDTPEMRQVNPNATFWQVESWEPLTLSPSILNNNCGCHGYIREGKWIDA